MENDQVGKKSPEMENFLKALAPARGTGFCATCQEPVWNNEFKDELSLVDFKITGICQACQDKICG